MLRFALIIALGGLIGAIIGITIPLLLLLYEFLFDPSFGEPGSGMVLILWVITVPGCAALGVIIGAVVGAYRD